MHSLMLRSGDIIDMMNEGIAAKYDLSCALLVDVQNSFAEIGADKPMGVPRFILLESFYWACNYQSHADCWGGGLELENAQISEGEQTGLGFNF